MTPTEVFDKPILPDPKKEGTDQDPDKEIDEEEQNDLNEIRVGDDVGEPNAEDKDLVPTNEPLSSEEPDSDETKE